MAAQAGTLDYADVGGLWLPTVAVPSVPPVGQFRADAWFPCHIGPPVPSGPSLDGRACTDCGTLAGTWAHTGGVCAKCHRQRMWLRGQSRRRRVLGQRAARHQQDARDKLDAANLAAQLAPTPDTLTAWVDGNYVQLRKAAQRTGRSVPVTWTRGRVVGLSNKSRKAIFATVNKLDKRAQPMWCTLTWPRVWPVQLAAQSALDALYTGLLTMQHWDGFGADAWAVLQRAASTLDKIYSPVLRRAGVAASQLTDADFQLLGDALQSVAGVALRWADGAASPAAAARAVTLASAALCALDALQSAQLKAWATVRKWYKRVQRLWPQVSIAWRLQPQQRGAPHYHGLAYGLRGDGDTDGAKFQQWAAAAWTDCVASALPTGLDNWQRDAHLLHGCQVTPVDGQTGVKKYLADYVSKSDASGAAAIAGRQWGVLGRKWLPVSATVTVNVPVDASFRLVRGVRRMASRLLHYSGGRVRKYKPRWRTRQGAGWVTDCPADWLAYGAATARGSHAAMLQRADALLHGDGVGAGPPVAAPVARVPVWRQSAAALAVHRADVAARWWARCAQRLRRDGVTAVDGVLSDIWQQATDATSRASSQLATSTDAAQSQRPRGPTD